MEFVKDIVGNKVRVGDEVIYSAYRQGGFKRATVTRIHPNSVTIVFPLKDLWGNILGQREKPSVSRFIKVVKEEANEQ